MRTLEYLVATSIDGFIARVDGDFTPLLVEGDHLQTLAEEVPETFPAQARQALGIDAPNRRFDTVLWAPAPTGCPEASPPRTRTCASTSSPDRFALRPT